MSKLLIDVHTEYQEFKYTLDFRLTDPDDSTPQGTLHFDSDTALHLTNRSKVYRGSLRKGEESIAQDVVCKLVEGDITGLKLEAELYDTLLYGMQAEHIPNYLGYYEGISHLTLRPIACMLLKYCGEPLGDAWSGIPMRVRIKAMEILLLLHAAGISHNDWGPHNIVTDEQGNLRVLDFSESTRHTCPVIDKSIELYQLAPPRYKFPCHEIYNAALSMEIFTPAIIGFMGFGVNMRYVKSPEDLVKAAARTDSFRTEEEIRREAVRVVTRYQQYCEGRGIKLDIAGTARTDQSPPVVEQ